MENNNQPSMPVGPQPPAPQPEPPRPAAPQSFQPVPPQSTQSQLDPQPLQPRTQPQAPRPMAPAGSAPVVPQPQPAAFGMPPQSPQPPRKSKKGLIIGGIIAGALLLSGIAGALAYSLWYQNSEKVVFDAITHAVTADSSTGTGELVVKSNDTTVKISFDGEAKDKDGRLNAKFSIDTKSSGQTVSVDVAASLLTKGDTIYVKLDNLRELAEEAYGSLDSMPPGLSSIIKKIDGQWVSAKTSDYEELSAEIAKQQRCISEISVDKAMKKELTELYKKNRILIIDEKLDAKKINGVGSLGYRVKGDTKAFEGFVRGLSDTKIGKEVVKCNDEIDFGEVADWIAKDLKDDNSSDSKVDIKVELWVSRFGHKLTEIKMTINDDNEGSGSFVFNPVFNKDVNIEVPKDAITAKELQADIEEAMDEYTSSFNSSYDYDYDYEIDSTSRSYNLN